MQREVVLDRGMIPSNLSVSTYAKIQSLPAYVCCVANFLEFELP